MKTVNSKLISKTFHITITALLFCVSYSYAQSISLQGVKRIQDLQFGTFVSTGSLGGTVIVGADGTRKSTGSIVLLGNDSQPAIFEVTVDTNRNNLDKIKLSSSYSYSPSLKLNGTGQNTFSLSVLVDPIANPGVGTYVPTNIKPNQFATTFPVGGTLTIPAGDSIGDAYTGTYFISVVNQ